MRAQMCKNLHRYLGSVLVFFVLMLYHLIKIASTICLLLRSMPKTIDIDALFVKVFDSLYNMMLGLGDWMEGPAMAFRQARAARHRRTCSR